MSSLCYICVNDAGGENPQVVQIMDFSAGRTQ